MATTDKKHDASETHASQAQEIAAAKQDIISTLDELSLSQLLQIQSLINGFTGLPKGMSGAEFVALMHELREKFQITDEEFEEFDRILREADEEEKRRYALPSHE